MSESPDNIEIANVSKWYGGHRDPAAAALHDVTLEIEPGELICMVGPSGCGKTTLLNLLAGFIKPTAGALRVQGAQITGPGPDRAVVFQDYALLPWYSVRRNIELGLKIQGLHPTEIARITDENLELVGLTSSQSKYPHQLSGGMQQRASIARALALDPTILLMDEPFGGLDEYTRMGLQSELIRIWERAGKTILFITHSVDEAIFLGTRIFVMAARPGRVIDHIPVQISQPRDRTSADFNDIKRRILRQLVLVP